MIEDPEEAPSERRAGVRDGILASIKRDVELRGARTARLLATAGVVGVVGALGVTLVMARHSYQHHPPWHVAVFSTVWAGLLFVAFAITLLQVRTPSLPLAWSSSVGILGLGLAGICGALCPDQHYLRWWWGTEIGQSLVETTGTAGSVLCLGVVTTLLFGLLASFVLLRASVRPVSALLPATILTVLLAPGVALQSVGTSAAVFVGWLAGSGAGAYLGVAAGIRARELASRFEAR